ncbi:hypothetical protein PIB30_003336 [Stylosanthes scabra]|uniref:Uncharacterized protein n=1 Tax=Stylosanthes scabra TaxID=79078 RepID=A0ABU6T4X8_9FABA|nr:hypothetical protein [Stylosanthes scabra]
MGHSTRASVALLININSTIKGDTGRVAGAHSATPTWVCQLYLVGVTHESQKSEEDVQRIVSVVKPDLAPQNSGVSQVSTLSNQQPPFSPPKAKGMATESDPRRPQVKATLRLGAESYSVQANKGCLSEQLVSLKEESMSILKDFITKHNIPQDVPDEPLEASSEDDDTSEKPQVNKSKKTKFA